MLGPCTQIDFSSPSRCSTHGRCLSISPSQSASPPATNQHNGKERSPFPRKLKYRELLSFYTIVDATQCCPPRASRGRRIYSPEEEKILGNCSVTKRQWMQRIIVPSGGAERIFQIFFLVATEHVSVYLASPRLRGEVPMRSEAERGSVSQTSQVLPRQKKFR